MALFEEDDLPTGKRVNPIPEVKDYKSAWVINQEQPFGTLLTHIGGMRWIVDYYSQVKGKDEEVGAFQPGLAVINRQLRKIQDMEIKVTRPALNEPTIEDSNQEATVRGSAIAYPNSVIPNPGDLIVAQGPDGRKGVYQICDRVLPKQIFKRTAYEFEFVLWQWLTPELNKTITEGTVEKYHFIRDNIDTGMNPILTTSEYSVMEKLMEYEESIPRYFFAMFRNFEYNALVVPGQDNSIYDAFHATFCNTVFSDQGEIDCFNVNLIPTQDGSNRQRYSIHSAFLLMDKTLTYTMYSQIPILPSKVFLAEPFFGGIRFQGTRYVIYPMMTHGDNFLGSSSIRQGTTIPFRKGVYAEAPTLKRLEDVFSDEYLGTPAFNPELAPDADYRPIGTDDYYIFSEAFYDRRFKEMSKIERLVWQTIEEEVVDPNEVCRLLDKSKEWPVLEQFYFIPFLYGMIPAAKRGI